MPLEVIGAGFGRTSTLSLKAALDTLGYKTHHMKEVHIPPAQDDLWTEAARNKAAGRPIDWQPIYGPRGYTATVDWPSAHFYKELFATNPDAKVILSVRESADKWYDSVMETIWPDGKAGSSFRPPRYLAWLFRGFIAHYVMVNEVIWNGTFKGRIEDREFAVKVYEEHIAEVVASIPPERLLVHKARDGWGPLCAFLGKQVPDVPYPHVNDAAQFKAKLGPARKVQRYNQIVAACNAALAVAALGAAVAAARIVVEARRR